MLQLSRSIALVLLLVSWQVAGEYEIVYFGCKKNRDGVCSKPVGNGKDQSLSWAVRSVPKTRNYQCPPTWQGECCPQHQFQDIDTAPLNILTRPLGDTGNCRHNGD
ncbi:hypothetical protein KEM48_013313 [Puccinia striiformis f. sp. tritici PST-130]|nr:hypothetical protein Pst134EB_024019 [Puccinia striiformis f. sp. tritici]KAI9631056.1 hypothetical protein KEM48_013313 [Puccinia striiformis f. sp. tritici PST-130]